MGVRHKHFTNMPIKHLTVTNNPIVPHRRSSSHNTTNINQLKPIKVTAYNVEDARFLLYKTVIDFCIVFSGAIGNRLTRKHDERVCMSTAFKRSVICKVNCLQTSQCYCAHSTNTTLLVRTTPDMEGKHMFVWRKEGTPEEMQEKPTWLH